ASPSHLPSTYSLRLTGRASRPNARLDSRSPEMLGAATSTDISASTAVNRNATKIKTCAARSRSATSPICAPPPGPVEERRWKHAQPVAPTTTTVSTSTAMSSFRRDASHMVSLAIVRMGASSGKSAAAFSEELQEAVLQGLVARLDGIEPAAHAHYLLDHVRDS